MDTTYTEKQYMQPDAVALILQWIEDYGGDREAVARYMCDSLRIGGIRACRALVEHAVYASKQPEHR